MKKSILPMAAIMMLASCTSLKFEGLKPVLGDDSYGALGSVAAGSDGLPSSQTWEASSSSATVSWA